MEEQEEDDEDNLVVVQLREPNNLACSREKWQILSHELLYDIHLVTRCNDNHKFHVVSLNNN